MRVFIPSENEDAIVRLQHKVFLHIVQDQGAVQIAPESTKILDENGPPRQRVLSVKSVVNQSTRIDLINNPISVVLSGCSINDKLVTKLAHSF